ncbi:extensin-like domain-containing protein [Rhodoblastus sp.]|uniref:extensin-like domain-containing protein n=1 Tax=Rhodoblastus sp. TaxID=1962975 RepID=UPI003F99CC84
MARRSQTALFIMLALGALAGCSKFQRAERPAWRARAEAACFAERRVALSNYVQPAAHEIDGPSICGLTRPLKVTALQGGAVQFNATQTLDCSMVAELESWLAEVVQPAAQARFGQPVAEIDSMGSYNCRGMNNQFGARLSEHSFGNALDVGGFRLADGRIITLVHDWTRGDPQTQAFLRDVHSGACGHFATVLSPGSNMFHYNHIHLDLAMHGMTSTGPRRICKPAPQMTEPPSLKEGPHKDNLPEAPEIDDDLDIAQVGAPRGASAYAMHSGPDLALAAATIAAADTSRRVSPNGPPAPPRRSAQTGPMALHAPAAAETPSPPARGAMREDGVFVPEGAPTDFDLPTSRFR